MNYQQSRSLSETAAYDDVYDLEYTTAHTWAVTQYAPALFTEGDRPNYGASTGDPDQQFASASHLAYARDDQTVDPNKYSLELDIGETAGAEEQQPTPTFSASFSTPHHHHSHRTISDLGQAANQLRDNPRYQQSPRESPWDAVAPTTTYQTSFTPSCFYDDPSHSFPSSTAARSQADADAQRYLRYLAPSTGDGASSYSGRTEGSTSCGVCGRAFSKPRQMRRHLSEVHRGEDDPQYVCKCGYGATRKQNYIRHINASCSKTHDVDLVFICTCREPSNDLTFHLEHIKKCGRKKAGRKPKNAPNARAQLATEGLSQLLASCPHRAY